MVNEPLLATKLYIPQLRPNHVHRPRLTEQLNEGLRSDYRLTLVSAPAGFGKTTLLSEWVHGLCEAKMPPQVAWLTLDEADNDPVRFMSYVIAAVQTLAPRIGRVAQDMLHRPQPPPLRGVLTELLNELCAVDIPDKTSPLVLIIDDCHVISMPQVHEALALLLKQLPPQVHLVVSTRADPPLPLSRLRANNQLVEVRTKDLRFTQTEAKLLLEQILGTALSRDDVAALESRTEGWVVGLQLAGLSLRGHDISSFIRAFNGSHRFVLDYLVDEVLNRQPKDVQEFLLATSGLERLSAPLCDAVIGREPAGDKAGKGKPSYEILGRLERANLFVVPLDEQRQWYRYHHLFRDLLRKRAGESQPDQIPIWHSRASEWYETQELMGEAVSHALAAGDADRVARLVERNTLAMMDHGELISLLGWLSALPEDVVHRSPWLCVAFAWAKAYSGQFDGAEILLRKADASLQCSATPASETQHIAGHIATIEAYLAGIRGDDIRAKASSRRALQLLPQRDLTTRGFAAAQLGMALRATDDLAAATDATIEASRICLAAGDSHVAIITLCDLAGLWSLRGRTKEAFDTYERALRLAREYTKDTGRELPVEAYVQGRMSTILKEWNELDSAVRYAAKGVEVCRRWGWMERFLDCSMYLALALLASGECTESLSIIREAKHIARGVSIWYEILIGIEEAHIQTCCGELENAVAWAARWEGKLDLGEERKKRDVLIYLELVRVVLTQTWAETGGDSSLARSDLREKLVKAAELLPDLAQEAEARGHIRRAVRILIRQTMALQLLGRTEDALVTLEHALSLGEPARYLRVFAVPQMKELLRQAAARGIRVDYVATILEVLDQDRIRLHKTDRSSAPPSDPSNEGKSDAVSRDALSEREFQVLRLIAVGMSNQEIADELILAVGTVKKHTNNIYRKLKVHSRGKAVARARELGLV